MRIEKMSIKRERIGNSIRLQMRELDFSHARPSGT
jgi:hypothetical protein